jgi:class 3 adenylate cyclase/HAMP domain-containing protein
LVDAAQTQSYQASASSARAIDSGRIVMLVITLASIVGAAVVMFRYVDPRIIRPIGHITSAMTNIAAGDTSGDIPGSDRHDELGRMAQALGVFRDTAIAVQEANLREIQTTRRRLAEAIESISEGFSLYDSDDRLVVSNSRYQQLLYPDMAEPLRPGVTFESILRHAVAQGYVKDAEDRTDAWIAERLASHREPGSPHVQQRRDGRYIMVSERRTDEGGTVAVYSDITELKQRETELAQKSKELEQLAGQLAKYLSPQVYESIFTGRQEVKVASQRKKLTVFFSDIADFTAMTEKLESEDLTLLLNQYLTEMSDIALSYGATIDKYVGDAIVIFFGDPESRGVQQDALDCVEMAIAMRDRMTELQTTWHNTGLEQPLECRMGVNTGYCTVGNFGSEARVDYTIIGAGVNLASRLESSASPGDILISYETYAWVKDRILCEAREPIAIKGISRPVATYRVIDTFERLDRQGDTVREHHPNLLIDMNLAAMSQDERKRAKDTLLQALTRLDVQKGTDEPDGA